MTRAEEESAAARAFAREMAVAAMEDMIRRFCPDYDRAYDGHYVEAAVDAIIEATR